jgi:hypothetical protein
MDEVIREYESLKGEFDDLLGRSKSLAIDYDALNERHGRAQRCVETAISLEEARGCF